MPSKPDDRAASVAALRLKVARALLRTLGSKAQVTLSRADAILIARTLLTGESRRRGRPVHRGDVHAAILDEYVYRRLDPERPRGWKAECVRDLAQWFDYADERSVRRIVDAHERDNRAALGTLAVAVKQATKQGRK